MTDDRPACRLESPDEICFCLKDRMWSCLYGVELSVTCKLNSVPLELYLLSATLHCPLLMGIIIDIKDVIKTSIGIVDVSHLCEFGKQSRPTRGTLRTVEGRLTQAGDDKNNPQTPVSL